MIMINKNHPSKLVLNFIKLSLNFYYGPSLVRVWVEFLVALLFFYEFSPIKGNAYELLSLCFSTIVNVFLKEFGFRIDDLAYVYISH